MRWEDERYVRVYTRDTVDWMALSFEAQGLFALLLRKVDRAGVLELGKRGKQAIAVAIGHPSKWKTIGPALEELIQDGCVVVETERLIIRNFIEAQEAKQSDKVRQAKSREMARSAILPLAAVTKRDEMSRESSERHTASQPVTSGHTASRDVTPAVLSQPCSAVPLNTSSDAAAPTSAGKRPRTSKPKAPRPSGAESDPRHHPLKLQMESDYQELLGEKWVFDESDAAALSQLLKLAGPEEIRARWRRALLDGFRTCRRVRELRSKWGYFGEAGPAQPTLPLSTDRPKLAFERCEVAECTAPGEGKWGAIRLCYPHLAQATVDDVSWQDGPAMRAWLEARSAEVRT